MSSKSSNSPAAENLAGAKVTVVGLGRFGGGIGVTRWLCAQGAKVTVSDQASADSLAESVATRLCISVRTTRPIFWTPTCWS